MTTTLDYEQVTAFAKAVRRELADLGPDVLDDLTDGLEADLADKLADGEPLGDAAEYAAELRAAAGVERTTRPSIADNVRANIADLRARVAPFTSHPVIAEVIAFFVAVRPVWWVLRAWGLFFILAGFHTAPSNPFDPWLLIALLVLSIQWGRGRWLPWKWSRGAVIALSVVALLALPTAASYLIQKIYYVDDMDPNDFIPTGLVLDRQQVTNIFAYGPDGEPLTGVQLFDQNGDALNVDSTGAETLWVWDETDQSESIMVPSNGVSGGTGWNIYPLEQIDPEDLTDMGEVPSWAKREQPTPPFASVQQLLGYEAPAVDDDPQP